MKVGALVLAAGEGHRFGGPKLLAPLRGRPLLSHVLDTLAGACRRRIVNRVHVVVASGDEGTRALVETAGFESVINGTPRQGLSHSLRLGLASLEGRGLDSALVFLGDQPFVQPEVVERLLESWLKGSATVIRPRYLGEPNVPGHPVLLDQSVWPLASLLEGDSGFAEILDSHSIPVAVLDVPGSNQDVDTVDDLNRLDLSS